MARTIKKGLDYFPFDVDLFQDIRIRKLIKYQGGKAVTVYTLLLCTIYRNGYYAMWDKELPFILSEISGYTEAYIMEVIECCMNIGLFSKELFESAKVLSSRGIQERYRKICSASRRNIPINEHSLLEEENADTVKDSKPQRAYAPPQKEKPLQPQPILQEPVTALYNKTIEQEVADMKHDNAWIKSLCNRHSISSEQLMAYIDDFSLQCSKSHTSFRDAKSHFHRWLVKQNREITATTTTTTAPSQSPDYTYDGGFGGQDI